GPDARTASVYHTRAAEALVELERYPEAKEKFFASLQKRPGHLPALLGLGHLALRQSDWATAAEAAEQEGSALKDTSLRVRALVVAGALASQQLADPTRAAADLRQALALDPK